MSADRSAPVPLIVVAFLALTLIWGTTWGAIRIGLEGIPPLWGVALRFGVASVVLLSVARIAGVKLGRNMIERRLWLVNAAFSFGIPYALVYWSEQTIPSGLAALLFAVYPIFVSLFAHRSLRDERLGWRGFGGCLLGFAGLATIFSEDLGRVAGEGALTAALAALAAALAAALGSVAVKRWGSEVHPLSLTAVPMGLTFVGLAPLAAWLERDRQIVLDAASVGALAYLSLAGTAVTFVIYYWLLARVRATRIALVAYTAPVVAVGVGVFLLDEPITPRLVAGGGGVLLGVWISTSGARSRPDRTVSG